MNTVQQVQHQGLERTGITGHTALLECPSDLGPYRLTGVEGLVGMLEDHLQGAPLCQRPSGHWPSGDVFTLPHNLTGRGSLQTHHHLRHGGFPRAGFPHERDNFTLARRKVMDSFALA